MRENLDVAQTLALARKSGEKLDRTPDDKPEGLAAAFALQQRVTHALGWTQCGWKVGATNPKAQAALGVGGPFLGPLFRERVFEDGVQVATAASNSRIVEPEIAFVMRTALPGRDRAYGVDEVLAAVATVHPAFELVNPRLPRGLREPVEWTIADGGISDAFVLGPGSAPARDLDYAAIETRAERNGSLVTTGVGANVLGGPERVLAWVANHLPGLGLQLQAGDIVTTGVLTDVIFGQLGDELRADFAAIGCVRMRL